MHGINSPSIYFKVFTQYILFKTLELQPPLEVRQDVGLAPQRVRRTSCFGRTGTNFLHSRGTPVGRRRTPSLLVFGRWTIRLSTEGRLELSGSDDNR